jgi:hypothetical protein
VNGRADAKVAEYTSPRTRLVALGGSMVAVRRKLLCKDRSW